MTTILATTSSFGKASPQAAQKIRDAGHDLIANPFGRKLTKDELVQLMAEHQPLGLLAGTEPVTREAMEAAPGLKAIARVGVGWDNVDHQAAADLGLPVSRTEGVLDQAVAELALGFMLDALRHVSAHDRDIRAGVWKKRMGSLLQGKTVGIVGMGAIGRRVAELVTAFGAGVVYADVNQVDAPLGEQCALPDLLGRAHIVTLHASGSGRILGEAELDQCRPGAMIVNTARGGLVDEEALAERLSNGRLGAACLDVFEREPYDGPLARAENAVLTSHVGSYAREARMAMELAAVDNLLADLERIRA